MKIIHIIYFLFLISVLRFFSPATNNTNLPSITLNLHNHKFDQNEIHIKANTKYILYINNKDDSAEEFESVDLSIEKIIPANSTKYIIISPLPVGIYNFHGEFHANTAFGKLIVK